MLSIIGRLASLMLSRRANNANVASSISVLATAFFTRYYGGSYHAVDQTKFSDAFKFVM